MEDDEAEPYVMLTPPADMSALTDAESRWLVPELSKDQQLRSLGRSARDLAHPRWCSLRDV
ncbi:hypothetical protein [Streptomyces sp. NBC_01373]|uniref:hypothetical protein n=1 Tax=Streptomyces sp. NBC_01373 TaxID=2903843 RepID=UPI00224DE1BB|nr:hypothetical protein [Streptomyces sp. NBC_01373]MCX4703059.1 hypothetical protein [Streptomyces sp. NBC_01373]